MLPCVVVDRWVEVETLHAALKEGQAGLVVGLLLEFKRAAVLHKFFEFGGLTTAQVFERGLDLLLLDGSILLVLGSAGKSLPWERAFKQVEQDVADTFQIIASGLFFTLMGRNGGISGGTSQILSILVWNMISLTIHVALGKTKVNDVDEVTGGLGRSDEEVIRLHITMDNSLGVDLLEMFHELNSNQKNRLHVELAFAVLEKIFEGRPE